MVVHVSKTDAPLAGTPDSLAGRRTDEFLSRLAEMGLTFIGSEGSDMVFSLRELSRRAGSIAGGQRNLITALEMLHTDAVSFNDEDPGYILGNNAISLAIGRGLESNIPHLCRLLTTVTPDEVFERLEAACAFVLNDKIDTRAENGVWLAEQLSRGAESDLRNAGLLDGPADYAQSLEPRAEVIPDLPREFQTEAKPWRSPFDTDGL